MPLLSRVSDFPLQPRAPGQGNVSQAARDRGMEPSRGKKEVERESREEKGCVQGTFLLRLRCIWPRGPCQDAKSN